MNLAGFAALLGVPVALAAIIAPTVLEIAPLRRLERLDQALKDSSVSGAHRAALEQARDTLAARAAFAVLVPTRWFTVIYGVLITLWGAVYMAVALYGEHPVVVLVRLDQSPLTFWLGVANSAAGLFLLWAARGRRNRMWKKLWNLPV